MNMRIAFMAVLLLLVAMHDDTAYVDAGIPVTQSESQIDPRSVSDSISSSPDGGSGSSGDSGGSDESLGDSGSDESPSLSDSPSFTESGSNSESKSPMKSQSPIFVVKAQATDTVGIYIATGVVFFVVFLLSTMVCVKLMSRPKVNQMRYAPQR